LTKSTDYAVRALIVLAGARGEYFSAREIAHRQDMPYQFVRRVLQTLIKSGLVESKEGSRGGVRLLKDPRGIKLEDIIKMFQGNIQLSECVFRKKICSNRATCVLRKQINLIEDKVAREFRGITIAKLMKA
jgi:Rrf2 family protein